MVIWLRNPHVELNGEVRALADIGLVEEGDIVRREVYASVVALDEAGEACRREHEAVLAEAQRRASEIVERAEQEALVLIEQAQQEYTDAERRGYEAGTTQAIGDWHARVAQHASEQRDMHVLLRERLAELVVMAVEQIVRSEDTGALFARSTTALDRIAEGCSYLKVRVHPDEYESAALEFSRFADERRARGRMAPVTVVADRELAPGACICESDLGMVDASLATQLAAVRAAVERALERETATVSVHALGSGSGADAGDIDESHSIHDDPMPTEQAQVLEITEDIGRDAIRAAPEGDPMLDAEEEAV
ncbi:type III secretion system stator protein SctL [Trinickia sp. NRRL B-1857]|uniref:type III secretion system stator protein SctL n=1 Tax=Trinickia sp. NRRL B-1857 TaxID=3162879 RepID=UPI003D27D210